MTESEFQEFLITIGYRYNKKSHTAFNSFEGFHTMIGFMEPEKKYSVILDAAATDPGKVASMLKSFGAENKDHISNVSYKDRKIRMTLKMTVDSEIDRENLKTVAHFMTELYKSELLLPLCRVCCRNRKSGLYVVGDTLMPICDSCLTRKRRQYERRRDMYEKKRQNMPLGMIGAVYGALLGAAFYVLLYQLFPSFGATAAFIAVGAFAGFVITGSRATKKSAVICFILSVLSFAAAEYVSLIASMAILIEREGGGIAVSEAIEATNMSFADGGYLTAILIESGIGLVVMVIVGVIYFLKRVYTRPLKISKNVL